MTAKSAKPKKSRERENLPLKTKIVVLTEAGYRCAVRGKGRMCSKRTDPFGLYRIKVEPETTVASLRSTLLRERLRIF